MRDPERIMHLEPRCDAIYDALRAIRGGQLDEMVLAADTVACLRVAAGIMLAINHLPEELIGELTRDAWELMAARTREWKGRA